MGNQIDHSKKIDDLLSISDIQSSKLKMK